MNTLIVSAHPEPASFGRALADAAMSALRELGHEVRLIDLYAEDFDPVVRPAQFLSRKDPTYFETMGEQAHAAAGGCVAADVGASQQQLIWCDTLILHFPLWWWSMPAIMKGWIDRVFASDFAYGVRDLRHRRALLLVTAETKAERFAATGPAHPLYHIEHGMLRFCGFEVLSPFIAADVWRATPAQRQANVAQVAAHVHTLLGKRNAPRH